MENLHIMNALHSAWQHKTKHKGLNMKAQYDRNLYVFVTVINTQVLNNRNTIHHFNIAKMKSLMAAQNSVVPRK